VWTKTYPLPIFTGQFTPLTKLQPLFFTAQSTPLNKRPLFSTPYFSSTPLTKPPPRKGKELKRGIFESEIGGGEVALDFASRFRGDRCHCPFVCSTLCLVGALYQLYSKAPLTYRHVMCASALILFSQAPVHAAQPFIGLRISQQTRSAVFSAVQVTKE